MAYVIGTAGHVDHGKSSLVLAMTGIDPDRLAEEKAREMTIDLGFAWLTLPGGTPVGVVDVPGHSDFIENMLAGVGGIDLALLVIAADEGVMPQTREHLAILDLLQVSSSVIVLTKIDLVDDPDWLDMVRIEATDLVQGTVLRDAPVVAVSSATGEGISTLLALIETLLQGRPARPEGGRPRLPVDRVFTMSGFGTIVTGTLTGGSFAVGQEAELLPAGRRVRIRGLQNHRQPVEHLPAGSRAAINLSGVNVEDIRRGDVVALPGMLSGTTLVDVYFRHLPDAERPLLHNTEVKFFSGAAESLAYIRLLGDHELVPGAEGWLQLRLSEPVTLDRGDRYILRYPSPPRTFGGGYVLDPHPPHRWRRFRPEVIERLETLSVGTSRERLIAALNSQIVVPSAEVAGLAGLPESEAASALAELLHTGEAREVGTGLFISSARHEQLRLLAERELAGFHEASPLRPGMPREEFRQRLALDGRVYGPLIGLLEEDGTLVDDGRSVRLSGFSVTFTPRQQQAVDDLKRRFDADPINTPSYRDSAALAGQEVLDLLIQRGDFVRVSDDVLFAAAGYAQMVERVRWYLDENGSITVAQARDLFNSSRKYVLALLEHLDAVGVTRRLEDKRVPGR
ncbi:MAG: selenocysteine-specific translation elongation factor [Anaerolineae bacterium]|nr:selenocysteine-specific translation elongation factor [Anaerolineae bacterium]